MKTFGIDESDNYRLIAQSRMVTAPPLISAILDSSVYIRTLHFGGPGALILEHARAGNIRIDISSQTLLTLGSRARIAYGAHGV
jgi:hypothetical protein